MRKQELWAIMWPRGWVNSPYYKFDQIEIVVPPYDGFVPRPGVPLALGLMKGPVDPLPALSLI